MHEMSLCLSLMNIVEAQAEINDFRKVKTIRLEIGAWSCVEPEALRFCFNAARQGGIAEFAELIFIHVPGQAFCFDCVRTVPIARRFDPCPLCGGRMLNLTHGVELTVKEMEVE